MPKVQIYTTNNCAVCKRAKTDMLLKGIAYEEKNVEENEQDFEAMMEATGRTAVPQFNIDGEWFPGYNSAVLERASHDEDDFELVGAGGQVYETCASCEG